MYVDQHEEMQLEGNNRKGKINELIRIEIADFYPFSFCSSNYRGIDREVFSLCMNFCFIFFFLNQGLKLTSQLHPSRVPIRAPIYLRGICYRIFQ